MNSRLTIQDLAALLAERTGKDRNSAELFLREFIAIVSHGVFTDKIVKVKGLGTFKIALMEKRESIHVNTGERFLIPAHYKFSFLPDKELRELANKPFSFFETTELNENVDFADLDMLTGMEETETEEESVEEIIPEKEEKITEPVELAEEEILKPAEPLEQAEEEPEPINEPSVAEEANVEESVEEEIKEPAETLQEDSRKEPVQLPFANDFSDTDYQFEDEEPSSSRWIKGAIIAGVIALIAAGSTFLYLNRSFFLGPEIPTTILTGKSLPDQAIEPVDTLQQEAPVAVAEIEAEEKDTVPVEPSVTSPEAPVTSPEILAKVKIATGNRLTLISLEYYGSKIFWVYLYDYNKAAIKDPNNIPVGTEILVPAPSLYGIDKHSRASIDKAAARQTEILSGHL